MYVREVIYSGSGRSCDMRMKRVGRWSSPIALSLLIILGTPLALLAGSSAGAAAPGAAPATETSAEPATGPGEVEVTATLPNGQPAAGATAIVEHVSWSGFGVPPAQTVKRTLTLDEKGKATASQLPLGNFSVAVFSEDAMFGDSGHLTADAPKAVSTLVLRGGVPCEGIVRAPDGKPVANAAVYAYEASLFGILPALDATAARATTDADGKFLSPVILKLPWRFCVAAEGFPRFITPQYAIDGRLLEITLAPGGSVAGKLVNSETQSPAAGIKVVVSGGRERYETTSDASGQFKQGGLPKGKASVFVEDTALVASGPNTCEITPDETAELTIPLVKGGTVKGVVVDGETGDPIAGVTASASPQGNESGGLARKSLAATAADGSFVIEGVGDGGYQVYASDGKRASKPTIVEARAGETIDGVVVTFNRPKPKGVEGRVLGAQGAPIEDAYLMFGGVNGQTFPERGQPMRGGRFSLDGMYGANAGYTVRALTLEGSTDPIPIPSAAEVPVTMTLRVVHPRTGIIEGQVLNANGQPVAHAEVIAQLAGSTSTSAISGQVLVADDQGRFTASTLFAEPYTIAVRDQGRGFTVEPEVGIISNGEFTRFDRNIIDLAVGQKVSNVVVRFEQTGMLIAGTVSGPDGNPLADARVEVVENPGVSGHSLSDGRFQIAVKDAGTYSLRIWRPGYSTALLNNIAAGSSAVRASLTKAAIVRGRVVDAASGKAIESFEIANVRGKIDPALTTVLPLFQDERGEPVDTRYTQFKPIRNVEGSFELPEVDATTPAIFVRAKGYRPAGLMAASAVAGSTVEGIEIGLEPAGQVSVTVLTYDRKPANYGQIMVAFPGGQLVRAAQIGERGKCLLEGLPLTEIEVQGEVSNCTPTYMTVTPTQGTPAELTLEMRSATRITVKVNTNSEGHAQFSAVLESVENPQGNRYESDLGSRQFYFNDVPNGQYTLYIQLHDDAGDSVIYQAPLEVDKTDQQEVEIDL
jgi:hypothetical protein